MKEELKVEEGDKEAKRGISDWTEKGSYVYKLE